jgi:hypothetical protein
MNAVDFDKMMRNALSARPKGEHLAPAPEKQGATTIKARKKAKAKPRK